jgi:very-short-patch-repair endonuclease
MGEPFIGSEAVASGVLAKSALRTRYTKVFPDVYVGAETELTPQLRAHAGWLWSGRRGIVAGLSASALHGAKWVDVTAPLEIIHTNRNPLPGIRVRSGAIGADEVGVIDGIPVTTSARTALDLGCWYAAGEAVAAIDALARATDLTMPDVDLLVGRYPGRRGIQQARTALGLVDAGAQSPKETWLRLLLMQMGLPRLQTQIPVRDEFAYIVAYLDMGWEDVKVAVEYDGDQHRSDRRQYTRDIRRLEALNRLGWIVIRVVAGDQPADIVRRVRSALSRRAPR